VGRTGRLRGISASRGFDPQTVQLVASCYTDCAVPAHMSIAANKSRGLSTTLLKCMQELEVVEKCDYGRYTETRIGR
jgi:hypothetical protein